MSFELCTQRCSYTLSLTLLSLKAFPRIMADSELPCDNAGRDIVSARGEEEEEEGRVGDLSEGKTEEELAPPEAEEEDAERERFTACWYPTMRWYNARASRTDTAGYYARSSPG